MNPLPPVIYKSIPFYKDTYMDLNDSTGVPDDPRYIRRTVKGEEAKQ